MAAKKKVEQTPLRTDLPIAVDLKKLHPHVRETMEAIKRREWSPGIRFNLDVSEEMVERSIQILQAIVRGCENRGMTVQVPKASQRSVIQPVLKLDRGEVEIRLREPSTQRVEPGPYGSTRVYTPTGYLIFTLENWNLYHYKGRKRWEERANKALETWVTDIVESIIGAANFLSSYQDKKDREELFRRATEAMSTFHKSVAETQEKALTRILGSARNVSIARELRAYIGEVEKRVEQGMDSPEDAEAWLAWARFVAIEMDPLSPGKEPWQEPAFRKLVLDLVPPINESPALG